MHLVALTLLLLQVLYAQNQLGFFYDGCLALNGGRCLDTFCSILGGKCIGSFIGPCKCQLNCVYSSTLNKCVNNGCSTECVLGPGKYCTCQKPLCLALPADQCVDNGCKKIKGKCQGGLIGPCICKFPIKV